MPSGAALTARDGIRAAPSLRADGVRGVDEFEAACARSGAPGQVRMPPKAIDAIVAANIDYHATDATGTAVARALGWPFCRDMRPGDAVRCDVLRRIYVRVNGRRPRELRPSPVTPIVRAAILAAVHGTGSAKRRKGTRTILDPERIVPCVDEHLRRDRTGILTLPEPARALRTLTFTVTATCITVLLVRAALKTQRAASVLGNVTLANAVVAQIAVAVVAWSAIAFARSVSRERARAQQKEPGSVTTAATYALVLAILFW